MNERVLVVAPHPDDEVLGAGGFISRITAAGGRVEVAIVTKGMSPPFDPELIRVGREEAGRAHGVLGVAETTFLDFPAAALDTVAHRDLNGSLAAQVARVRPTTVLLPFPGDIHADHQAVFASGLVACRPSQGWMPRRILAYETLSETNWNAPYLSPGFHPNVFVDIGPVLDRKLSAMRAFQSQLKPFPHERSIEALESLARLRGATVGLAAAEAFVLVRGVE